MSDEIQDDIESAGEYQQQQEQRRLRDGDPDLFFIRNHGDLVARHRAEMEALKALNWALDRLFK